MNSNEKDINNPLFYLEEVFPDAAGIFKYYKNIDESFDNALFVFDTNVLILPYSLGTDELGPLKELFKSLIDNNRLFIPKRVAREFAKNRNTKLSEIYKTIFDYKVGKNQRAPKNYPILNGINEKIQLDVVLNKVIEAENDLYKAVDALANIIRGWQWNDPVSKVYTELFKPDIFIDHGKDNEFLKNEIDRRFTRNIPPGYKDKSKGDGGIGDLAIWLSILNLGSKEKRDIIFVSQDNKPDWWTKSNGSEFLPRFELIDEYSRSSEGKTFHIISFSKLLELFKMKAKLIEETKKAELHIEKKRLKLRKFTNRRKLFQIKSKEKQIEEIKEWFYSKFQDPADICPFESKEGGYQFIWGGPYDAKEEIDSKFGDRASEEVINEAVSELEEFCIEWSAKPQNEDNSDELHDNINDLF